MCFQFRVVPWYQKILILPMMRIFQCSTVQGELNIVFRDFRGSEQAGEWWLLSGQKVNEEMMSCHEEVETPLWNLSLELIKQK